MSSGIRTRSGFTLVELVMVMVMVGVLAAVAVPRFGEGAQLRQLSAGHKRILADIEYASELARSQSAGVLMAFDAVGDRYAIAGARNPLTRVTTGYTTDLSDVPYRINLGIVNLGGDSILMHDGYGRRDSGGTVQISSGSLSRTITIEAP